MEPPTINSAEIVRANTLLSGRPLGLRWRSSYWFTTFVVGLGIAIDVVVYSIIIPVVPFQLQRLGYTGVSTLTGWLLFAYSGGLLASTIPVAMLSERYHARKYPMLVGVLALIGSQVLFMEAPTFAVMCVARIMQGISSSVVWVVGLAFLCDATPPEVLGRQLGLATCGVPLGLVLAPPVGGLLYTRFGFRGPFVLVLVASFLDLLSRLIVIEPKEAVKWGHNPLVLSKSAKARAESTSATAQSSVSELGILPEGQQDSQPRGDPEISGGEGLNGAKHQEIKPLSLVQVIVRLVKSSRALVGLLLSFVFGFVYSCQEPPLPLHLQSVWDLSSERVGILFLAFSLPMLFSSLISGWLTDIVGSEWIVTFSILLALPWWGLVTLQRSLVLFGTAFSLQSFFTAGALSPLTVELAAVARNIEGVGYAHVYAAFNVAYGTGTTVGPIVGGQMYDHIRRGWLSICVLSGSLLFVSVFLAIPYTGDKPLLRKFRDIIEKRGQNETV